MGSITRSLFVHNIGLRRTIPWLQGSFWFDFQPRSIRSICRGFRGTLGLRIAPGGCCWFGGLRHIMGIESSLVQPPCFLLALKKTSLCVASSSFRQRTEAEQRQIPENAERETFLSKSDSENQSKNSNSSALLHQADKMVSEPKSQKFCCPPKDRNCEEDLGTAKPMGGSKLCPEIQHSGSSLAWLQHMERTQWLKQPKLPRGIINYEFLTWLDRPGNKHLKRNDSG